MLGLKVKGRDPADFMLMNRWVRQRALIAQGQWQINLREQQDFFKKLAQISTSTDRLAENYKLERMRLLEHLCFDALVDEQGEYIAFCGIFNGERYPDGVFRVLNRAWVAPEFRHINGRFAAINSKYLLPLQMQKFAEQIKHAFVSRERLQGRHFLKYWIAHHAPQSGWELSPQLVKVAPEGQDASCYQYIAQRRFATVDWQPPTMTAEEWKKLVGRAHAAHE